VLLPPVALLLHLLRHPPPQWQQKQQQLMEGQHILRRCSGCTPARALLPLSHHSCGMQQQQRLLLVMLHRTRPHLMCCLPSHRQHWQQQQVQVQAVLVGRHRLQRQQKRHPWQSKQQQQVQQPVMMTMLKWKAVALRPKSMAVQGLAGLQHLMPSTHSPCQRQQLQPHPAQQQQQQVLAVLLLRLRGSLRPQLLHQLT
jgi:hypothetical protein